MISTAKPAITKLRRLRRLARFSACGSLPAPPPPRTAAARTGRSAGATRRATVRRDGGPCANPAGTADGGGAHRGGAHRCPAGTAGHLGPARRTGNLSPPGNRTRHLCPARRTARHLGPARPTRDLSPPGNRTRHLCPTRRTARHLRPARPTRDLSPPGPADLRTAGAAADRSAPAGARRGHGGPPGAAGTAVRIRARLRFLLLTGRLRAPVRGIGIAVRVHSSHPAVSGPAP